MLIQLCQKDSSISRISRVVDYIVENIDLDETSKLAGMSVNNFHKLFK